MPVRGPILALDLSKTTGIAVGRPGDRPVLSTQKFARWEGATLAEAAAGAIRWLPELLAVHQPELIVVEAALLPRASRDATSARLALGFDFLVKGAAQCRGMRCEEAHRGTWTKFVLGCGNLNRTQAKAQMVALCRRMDLAPQNDDEADAAGVWFWACSQYGGRAFDETLPLMAKARMAA